MKFCSQMGLAHWCKGRKSSEKTVLVALPGRQRDKSKDQDCVTEADVRSFETEGVIVLRNVVSQQELRAVELGIEQNRSNPGQRAGIASAYTDPGYFFEDFCRWRDIAQFRNFLFHSKLPAISAKLLQSDCIRLYHDHVLVKEANTTQSTPWHQDQPYYNIAGSQNISFWIPMDPVPIESSLQCVQGSHKTGTWYMPRTFASKEAKWFAEGTLPEIPNIEQSKVKSWDLQSGDVVAFHMLTIHGCRGSKNLRRVFSARYVGDDTRHAPRPWRTSPEFPPTLKEELPADAELNHVMFPVVFQRIID
jgi:ectoine hydroxylase-related dioxygenase (phytanoyl-CoA dioxygenase family)